MTITTYYYGLMVNGTVTYKIPVIIKDKQLMPNRPKEKRTFADEFTVLRKTDYTITWLDKFDHDFRQGHPFRLSFELGAQDGTQHFHLHLTWLDKIKMKIIWDKYWLFRGDNFRNYIFPVIIGVISALITTFIKDIVTKDNNKGTDNTYEQPVK